MEYLVKPSITVSSAMTIEILRAVLAWLGSYLVRARRLRVSSSMSNGTCGLLTIGNSWSFTDVSAYMNPVILKHALVVVIPKENGMTHSSESTVIST